MLGNIYMTTEEIISKYNLELLETNGEVKFYKDNSAGKEYQLVNGEFIEVNNGRIVYKLIRQVNGYIIKYNTNGLYGFTIFRGKLPLEDRIWSLKQAVQIACEM